MEKKKVLRGLLLAGFVMFCLTGGDALAAGSLMTSGQLTSVEDNGTVVIDGKDYRLDPSAQIMDGEGRSVMLERLSLPVRVHYEYVDTNSGPIIKLIKEHPKVVPQ